MLDEGGMNRHLNNALHEHEPKDGVLTAVEDFLSASRQELDLIELPGIHGLGILTPTSLKKQNPDLARLLGELDFPPSVVRYVDGVERARLELQVRQQEEGREHELYVRKIDRARLEEHQEARQRLAEESRKLREERQRLKEVRHELNLANQDVLRLIRWLEALDSGISALFRSRQWKAGSIARGLYHRATFKDERLAVDEHLEDVLRMFRAWRRGGTGQDADVKRGGEE